MAAPADGEEGEDRRMPFTEHLAELRTRLRNSVIAVLIGFVASFLVSDSLMAVMIRPLEIAWSQAPKELNLGPLDLIWTHPADGMMVSLKLALLTGVFLGAPVIFHQVWKFIAPGLYQKERRLAVPFIFSSVVLFCGGAVFFYMFVLPAGLKYFLSFASSSGGHLNDVLARHDIHLTVHTYAIKPLIALDEYFGFTSTLGLLFGCVFELPLLLAVLAMIGIVSPRGLWRFNRYAILIFFVLGAIVTPGDMVVGQIAMGGALTVLYNLSIVAALLVGRKRRRERAQEEAKEAAAAE
jgi:sec-independent protein translocase protein TatC